MITIRQSKIIQSAKETFGYLQDIIYPPRCAVCGHACKEVGMVCGKCRNVFSLVRQPVCLKCGKQISLPEKEYCYDCLKKRFHYVRGFPVFNNDENVKRSISQFKYHNKKEYAVYYARSIYARFGDEIKRTRASYLVPVPIHKSRLKKRGYNQAKVLCDELSKLTGIPVLDGFLIRNKKTLPQKELNDLERLKNLSQAFETIKSNDIINKEGIETVMLVDDIYTTGSTIEACTLALMKAGVKQVFYTGIAIGKGYQ